MGNCFGSVPPRENSGINRSWESETTDTNSAAITNSDFSAATNDGSGSDAFTMGQVMEVPALRAFTLSELKSATNNFNPKNMVGRGGFGGVFQGWLDKATLNPSKPGTGMPVAVKRLNPEHGQGFEQWQSEVDFLGRLSHPNLVKLIGYCWETKELLLVYEFLSRGSLENHLFRGDADDAMPWESRLRIALGAARGLQFLHSLDKQIIYRDFKPSNILLDSNYCVKIADFGLAKLLPSGGVSHLSTRVYGTQGYVAPEYIATGHLYVKSDVYGFGVMLLEMMTGQKAFDSERGHKKQQLVDWMMPELIKKRRLRGIMDPRIAKQCTPRAMHLAAQLTRRCLEDDPRQRPSMEEVVSDLEILNSMKIS